MLIRTIELRFRGQFSDEIRETITGIAAKQELEIGELLPTDTGIHLQLTWLGHDVPHFRKMVERALRATRLWLRSREAGGVKASLRRDPRKVWIVHGRDLPLRKAMDAFLRSLGLEPMNFTDSVGRTGKAAPFVGEILDAAFNECQAVVVILSGDDVASLRKDLWGKREAEHERKPTPQPRANVLFEAGLAFGRHPDRTILVRVGRVRPFSNIDGRHLVDMTDRREAREDLARRLKSAGCPVRPIGNTWQAAGAFSRPAGPTRSPRQPRATSPPSLPAPRGKVTLVHETCGGECNILITRDKRTGQLEYEVEIPGEIVTASYPEFLEPTSFPSLDGLAECFFEISRENPEVKSHLEAALREARRRDVQSRRGGAR